MRKFHSNHLEVEDFSADMKNCFRCFIGTGYMCTPLNLWSM